MTSLATRSGTFKTTQLATQFVDLDALKTTPASSEEAAWPVGPAKVYPSEYRQPVGSASGHLPQTFAFGCIGESVPIL
jgi:hypothetical protein